MRSGWRILSTQWPSPSVGIHWWCRPHPSSLTLASQNKMKTSLVIDLIGFYSWLVNWGSLYSSAENEHSHCKVAQHRPADPDSCRPERPVFRRNYFQMICFLTVWFCKHFIDTFCTSKLYLNHDLLPPPFFFLFTFIFSIWYLAGKIHLKDWFSFSYENSSRHRLSAILRMVTVHSCVCWGRR